MPLERLRRILSQPLTVSVESSQALVQRVNQAAAARATMNPKLAVEFGPLAGARDHEVRPIDLLRKIGEMTTPPMLNLARLSASWATRRYFWAIHDYGTPGGPSDGRRKRFKLSADAREMERHQKTLLSDEFGIGFTGLIMEQLLGVDEAIDMQFALRNPATYFGVTKVLSREPDYLMWRSDGSAFIVEAKGSQTSYGSAIQQLRRGLEQVPSITIPGTATPPRLVIATYLASSRTRILIVDPPGSDLPDDDELIATDEQSKELRRTGEREWRVADIKAFREKLQVGANLAKLRWTAQHRLASQLEVSVGFRDKAVPVEVPDPDLSMVQTRSGTFIGFETPLAPELGGNGLKLFRGIQEEIFRQLSQHQLDVDSPGEVPPNDDPTLSVSGTGVCLAVRGLQ